MSITNYNGSSINNTNSITGTIGDLFSPTNIKSAQQLREEEKEREQKKLNYYTKILEGSQNVQKNHEKETIEYDAKNNKNSDERTKRRRKEHERKSKKLANKRQLNENNKNKYKPNFLDSIKTTWNEYSAKKRGDTLLIHFGHKPKEGDKAIQTCDELKKKKYDKRYGKFYCVDTETHEQKDPFEILEDLKNIYEEAKKDGIKTIKFYLDGHGSIDDFFSLEFSMEEFLQSLEYLDEKYNDMNFLFVKTPCFDGDNNDFYKFYWEEIIRDFSLKHPKTKIIAQEHADKDSSHWIMERAYSRDQFGFKYYQWCNGTKTEIDKDDKKIFGGTYEKSEEFNDLKANAWSLMFALLSSLVAGAALGGTTYGIRECVKKCDRSKNNVENNSEVNIINSSENNINIINSEENKNSKWQISKSVCNKVPKNIDGNIELVDINNNNDKILSQSVNVKVKNKFGM